MGGESVNSYMFVEKIISTNRRILLDHDLLPIVVTMYVFVG